MNQNIVGNSSPIRVEIEGKITIKTEIDYDSSAENIPLADLNAYSDKKGNIVEFYEEETRDFKSEPKGGPSGSGKQFLPSESENVATKMVASNFDEASFHAADSGNIVDFYEGETCLIKPEPNSGESGNGERNSRSEHPESEKRFPCPECDKAFSFKCRLTRHVRAVHQKIRKYVCQECSHAFAHPGYLKKHVESVHLKLKKYVCEECGHAFSEQGNLKKHIDAVHLKLKKYVCQECSHAFPQQGNLKTHIDTIHQNLKEYICQECSHTFSDQGNLKKHVDAVHLKLKKFSCGECGCSFAQKGTLKRHIERHHGNV